MRRSCALLVVGALLLGACGDSSDSSGESGAGTEKVESGEVEKLIVDAQKKATPDLRVGEATCPDRVEVREGATFECTLDLEGVQAPYTVTLSDVDADRGRAHVDVKPAKAILGVEKLADFVRNAASDPAVTVDCGAGRVRLADVGSEVECTATDAQGVHTVVVRVNDASGNVTLVGER